MRLPLLALSLLLIATPARGDALPGLIALELEGKGVHFFAPVRVGDRHFLAHLDTGANTSTVFADVLPALRPTGTAKVGGVNGVQDIAQTEIAGIGFGGEVFGTLKVDLRPTYGRAGGVPAPVAMSLGTDVLFRKPLLFDPLRQEARFLDAVTPGHWKGAEVIPADFKPRKPCLMPARLGPQAIRVMFDTGAGAGVLNLRHHADSPHARPLAGDWKVVDVNGAKRDTVMLKTSLLGVGTHRFSPRTLIGVDLTGMETALDERVDMILGADAIRERRWVLDPAGQRVLVFK